MTIPNRSREAAATSPGPLPDRKGPGPENQFIRLRSPALHARELKVLHAVSALPAELHTPAAAATALVVGGIGIPYSSVCTILRRLERKGALRLGRMKP